MVDRLLKSMCKKKTQLLLHLNTFFMSATLAFVSEDVFVPEDESLSRFRWGWIASVSDLFDVSEEAQVPEDKSLMCCRLSWTSSARKLRSP